MSAPLGFREDVGRLKSRVDMLKVDIPHKDMLSNEKVVHLDVLCPSMEDKVSSKMYTTEIVVVDQGWVVDGDVHVF